MSREIKGIHVLMIFGAAFGLIIGVNLTLAFNAVRTFPGLEVKNSYVASQSFEVKRASQNALAWDVSAQVAAKRLVLSITHDGKPLRPAIEKAVLGRATSVAADRELTFVYLGGAFVAPVSLSPGNWNLRLRARALDGTLFSQRIVIEVRS